MPRKTRAQQEMGDFQTPFQLAKAVCERLRFHGLAPSSVVEPTCGLGSFLGAAAEAFPDAGRLVGLELREDYLAEAARTMQGEIANGRLSLRREDLFVVDWARLLGDLPQPVLVLGNPPWVTSAALGRLGSSNLPPKVNSEGLRGLEAMTGRSNFDISEWLLLRLLEGLAPLEGAALAMLVKTSVARRVLRHAFRRGLPFGEAHLFGLDTSAEFGASVDAALLFLLRGGDLASPCCVRWRGLDSTSPDGRIAWVDGLLVADREAYEGARELRASEPQGWRSGVKHDCVKVLELRREGDALRNGMGEPVDVEDEVLYPLLKSSDLGRGVKRVRRWLLLTQRSMGEPPELLRERAPRAWAYLDGHRALLSRRKSSIYKGRPPFAIFGIGGYSFIEWKVAVSGLYKRPRFVAVGPEGTRPVLFDDTVYFRPCSGEAEALHLEELLNGPGAAKYFEALLFPDAKRPVTMALLDGLDLGALRSAKMPR